jgi:hypothetical protein
MLAPRQIRSALLALVVSACASAADNTNVSSTMPTYHSTVSEVRVTFFATDENNHALASLSKGDLPSSTTIASSTTSAASLIPMKPRSTS